jgi:hypothetical protein
MIYVGDGKSDIPCFAAIRDKCGKSFAVYRKNNHKSIREAYYLEKQNRVIAMGPANFTKGGHTRIYLEQMVAEIANRIVHETEEKIATVIGFPPKP